MEYINIDKARIQWKSSQSTLSSLGHFLEHLTCIPRQLTKPQFFRCSRLTPTIRGFFFLQALVCFGYPCFACFSTFARINQCHCDQFQTLRLYSDSHALCNDVGKITLFVATFVAFGIRFRAIDRNGGGDDKMIWTQMEMHSRVGLQRQVTSCHIRERNKRYFFKNKTKYISDGYLCNFPKIRL